MYIRTSALIVAMALTLCGSSKLDFTEYWDAVFCTFCNQLRCGMLDNDVEICAVKHRLKICGCGATTRAVTNSRLNHACRNYKDELRYA